MGTTETIMQQCERLIDEKRALLRELEDLRALQVNGFDPIAAARAYPRLVEAMRALIEAEKHRRIDEDAVYNAQNSAAALMRELGEAP